MIHHYRNRCVCSRRVIRWLFLVVLMLATWSDVDAEIEIIGAGFGRTGTMSLKEALDKLGYKTYHMVEMLKLSTMDISYKHHVNAWENYFQGELAVKDLAKTVYENHGYTAAVDFPTSGAWQDLAQHYPNAKIIYTERSSAQVWWESGIETILVTKPSMRILTSLHPVLRNFPRMVKAMWMKLLGVEKLTKEDRDIAIAGYHKNAQAAREFDAKRILIFNVKQGWEPLCEFLGRDVPNDIPFPNKNSRAEFQHRLFWMDLGIAVPPVVILMGIVLCIRKFVARANPKAAKAE